MLIAYLLALTSKLGSACGALIGLMWIIPPFIVSRFRTWFIRLNQKPIVISPQGDKFKNHQEECLEGSKIQIE